MSALPKKTDWPEDTAASLERRIRERMFEIATSDPNAVDLVEVNELIRERAENSFKRRVSAAKSRAMSSMQRELAD